MTEITNMIGCIKGILVHDLVGSQMFAKIDDKSIQTKQYKERLFSKSRSHRTKDDLFRLDQTLVLHKFTKELHFYVIGHTNESPILLDSVLECVVDVVTSLLKSTEKQSFLKKRAKILGAINEICDNGMILEADSELVLEMMSSKDDLSEQTMTQTMTNFKFPWIR
uniref:Coatomer subunit zeta n=1 Tax=Aceria tosichella TaxID=561515 RepID=A0A6G1SEU9_9ACAR